MLGWRSGFVLQNESRLTPLALTQFLRSTVPPMASNTALLRRFDDYGRLTVRQRRSWREVVMARETRNRYQVVDGSGQMVLSVEEGGAGFGDFLARLVLGSMRPFSTQVRLPDARPPLLQLRRPFRWVFHRLEVWDGSNQLLGTITRRWSWLHRFYEIEDRVTRSQLKIVGTFLRPWTFEIRRDGQIIGLIQKKWSGSAQDIFTDADNFSVSLDRLEHPSLRALAFSATVLLDVVYFERAKD